MDTSTAQWQQGTGNMGDHHHHHQHHQVLMASSNNNIMANSTPTKSQTTDQKKAKPQEQRNCPRCNSSNTKFCYYNNYSLTQPRYFCKTCRRYWTEGGSLRNVPVGGGSRKNKKSSININPSSSSSNSMMISTSSSSKMVNANVPDLNPPLFSNSTTLQGGQDLNLAYPSSNGLYNMTANKSQIISEQSQNPSFVVPGGFAFQELKPISGSGVTQGFCVDGLGNLGGARFSNNNGFRVLPERNNNNNNNILFPFGGEMKHVEADDQNKLGQGNNNNPGGYWSGLLGGGSW